MKKLIITLAILSSVLRTFAEDANIYYTGKQNRFRVGNVCYNNNVVMWRSVPKQFEGARISLLPGEPSDREIYEFKVKKSGFVYILVHESQKEVLDEWTEIYTGEYGIDDGFINTYIILKKEFDIGTYKLPYTKYLKTRVIIL